MKKLIAFIMSVICILALVGCNGNPNDSSSGIIQPENNGPVSSQSQQKLVKDPLTGEKTLSSSAKNKRPVAIMINNIKVSLPQRGISEASIIYEVLAEGGITRLLAVFPDAAKIPDVGSVRSARHYYLSLANAHNSIFVHFGGSKYVLDYIKNNKVSTINFLNTQGSYRDPNRVGKIPIEHTAFTSGARLIKAIESKKIQQSGKIADAYKFGDNASVMANGEAANNITLPFSSYTKATFTYNAGSGKYEKGQFGTAHIDESTGKALEFENIFILKTSINLMNANSKANYIDVKLTNGSGYYACDGKIIPINWSKDGFDGKMKYTTLDGKELKVTPGKSYVGITSVDTNVTYAE